MVSKEALKQNYFRSISFMQIQVCNRHDCSSNLNFLAQFPSALSHQERSFAFKWELDNNLYTKNDRTRFTTQKTTMQLYFWDSSSICFFSLFRQVLIMPFLINLFFPPPSPAPFISLSPLLYSYRILGYTLVAMGFIHLQANQKGSPALMDKTIFLTTLGDYSLLIASNRRKSHRK